MFEKGAKAVPVALLTEFNDVLVLLDCFERVIGSRNPSSISHPSFVFIHNNSIEYESDYSKTIP